MRERSRIVSNYSKNNIFERLGSCIPGYKGYTEKEERRDTDKLLRIQIAEQLDSNRSKIDSFILKEASENNHSAVILLDSLKKKLDLMANRIRYAPSGYSGFFDVVQIKSNDLDKLYAYDLTLMGLSENFGKLIEETMGVNENETYDAILSALSDFELRYSERDKAISEI